MFLFRPREAFIALLVFGMAVLMCKLFAPLPPWLGVLAGGSLILGVGGIVAEIIERPAQPVDIWLAQRELMAMSGQRMPSAPSITNDSFLYTALTLEELAETLLAQGRALIRHAPNSMLGNEALIVSASMRKLSKNVRGVVANSAAFEYPLSASEAEEILDGTTDVAVTTAGLGLSMGLPNEAAYLEVASSNASKANPQTGIIAKDPSGKWIKGENYRKPNLLAVLAAQSTRNDEANWQP